MRCRLLGRDISPVDPCETDCFPWFCASLFGRSFSSSAISIAYNISAEGRLRSWKIKTSGLKPRVIFFDRMSADVQQAHRPGALKQQNKSHKHGKHKSKGQLDKETKGMGTATVSV